MPKGMAASFDTQQWITFEIRGHQKTRDKRPSNGFPNSGSSPSNGIFLNKMEKDLGAYFLSF